MVLIHVSGCAFERAIPIKYVVNGAHAPIDAHLFCDKMVGCSFVRPELAIFFFHDCGFESVIFLTFDWSGDRLS